jgi:hypothetical protein
MARVVIERPRYHSSGRYHEVRPRDVTRRDIETLGDLPHCEGMRRPHVRRKSLSDLLGPLRKFLVRQVGRPWDNVYSEICERISPNSTVQLHILGHIEDLIEIKVIVDTEGRLRRPPGRRWRSSAYLDDRPGLLYVDPRTGIIRRVPEARSPLKRRAKTANPEIKAVGPERELWRRGGIWYWAVFGTSSGASSDVPQPADYFTEEPVKPGARYRVAPRQASSRDLRRLGLTNEPSGE